MNGRDKARPFDCAAYQTPYKYGREALAPSGLPDAYDRLGVDCPFVFWHGGKWQMLHVGFDGRGYRTALARSDDLRTWENSGILFDGRYLAGVWLLRENDLMGLPRLKRHDGKYWMVCHAYPGEGYETGPADIFLAWCGEESLTDWHLLPEPILSWRDGAAWERGGLYKGCLVEHEGRFCLFYNAKDRDEWPWHEQIGLAISEDLAHWQRRGNLPLVPVGAEGAWDSRFAADPFVVRDNGKWLMFYYGYDLAHAQDGLAVSEDLLHWEKCPEPILRYGKAGEIDSRHAHKPCVIAAGACGMEEEERVEGERSGLRSAEHQEKKMGYEQGRKEEYLLHFYCAVREARPGDTGVREDEDTGAQEYRCITFVSSREC